MKLEEKEFLTFVIEDALQNANLICGQALGIFSNSSKECATVVVNMVMK